MEVIIRIIQAEREDLSMSDWVTDEAVRLKKSLDAMHVKNKKSTQDFERKVNEGPHFWETTRSVIKRFIGELNEKVGRELFFWGVRKKRWMPSLSLLRRAITYR